MNNIFLAIGPESFLLQEFIGGYKKAAQKKYGDFAVQSFDLSQTPVSTIINEIISPPLFSEKRIIFIEGFPPSASPKISEKKKEEYEKLLNAIESADKNTIIIVVQNSPDKRTKFFKTLQKISEKVYDHPSFNPQKEGHKIEEWCTKRAAQLGVSLDAATAHFLRSFCGNDLQKLFTEIQKLSFYTEGEPITKQHIIDLCVPDESNADFAFSNAVSSKKKENILHALESLVQEFDPITVWNRDILSTVRTLITIRFAQDFPQEKTKVHPFIMKKMQNVIQGKTKEEMMDLHNFLLEIDIQSKNGMISASGEANDFLLSVQKIIYQYL